MSDLARDERPAVAIGHLALSVEDVDPSCRFYGALGLRFLDQGEDMAILELRGGTHLLLFRRGGPDAGADPAPEGIDLMIAERSLEAITAFRSGLVALGYKPGPIPASRTHGHLSFTVKDPDGNEVTVSTSHASDLPI
jgi:catechol 2,3-dioxygenase-like lactoylglutathione lyase family enzyme